MSSVHFVFFSIDHNVPCSLHDEAWLGCHAWRGSLGHRWGILLHVHAGVSLVKNGWRVCYSRGNRGVWRSGREWRGRSERRGRRVGDGLSRRSLGDFKWGKRRARRGIGMEEPLTSLWRAAGLEGRSWEREGWGAAGAMWCPFSTISWSFSILTLRMCASFLLLWYSSMNVSKGVAPSRRESAMFWFEKEK